MKHQINKKYFLVPSFWAALLLSCFLLSCNSTKYVLKDQHLLRSNHLNIKSDKTITNKGVLEDQLNLLVVQKPNTYWSGLIPFKLIKYNWSAEKYEENPNLDLPKSLERPVIYDSALQKRSTENMRNFLQNQGYFRAQVEDDVHFKGKKAAANYNINTGPSYWIHDLSYQINNPSIASIVQAAQSKTLLKPETPYTKTLLDEERSRIIMLLQNEGYYKFSQENVSFELDTFDKKTFRNNENLFESAINFVTLQKQQKRLSVDIKIIISDTLSKDSYQKYTIGKIIVFPDFIDRSLAFDSNMIVKNYDGLVFRYKNYYVREAVLAKKIFIRKGDTYSKTNHEQTLNRLNELGIFQMVNIYFVEDTTQKEQKRLNCYVTMYPSKGKDFITSFEMANSVTYWLGNSLGVTYRNKNFFKGANLLSIAATGGVEMNYYDSVGNTIIEHLKQQSTNFGLNGSLLFPKFISPYIPKWMDNKNLPNTQLVLGLSILDRINLFRLTNIFSSFSYNWRPTLTQTWDLSPAFANIVLPKISPQFQSSLDSNSYLRNTYRRTLIEGENIAYTYTDQAKKMNRNYNYIRVGFEEAGLLLSGINSLQKSIKNNNGFIYDQYTKFDIDARRYFNARRSLMALRFLAGIGIPYGESKTLPYIKQYFVGGPYSIRGWRPRTLGPQSNSSKTDSLNVDRTGDIKLEMNAEYRFDMIQLFSGTLQLNGALFADAGNVWLSKKDPETPGGNLDISRFGHDIAVSTGAGLRVIVAEFFTIRLDAAFPIKKPYVPANNGWVLNQVDLSDRSWRNKNVVLNVAIGMPF